MPTSERSDPRISVNDLALFMVSSDTMRLSIIKRNKFPKPPPLIRYRDVRPIVVAFLADIKRDIQIITKSESMFEQRKQDSSQSSLRQDDAKQSIEVLHALQGMQNKLNAYRFSAAPSNQADLLISGVRVSVRLDMLVHATLKGVDQVGGAILRLTQDDADTDGAKAKRKDMGMFVAALARMQQEIHPTAGAQIANRLCMAIDVRHGEVFASAASNVRRINDIENACRFIAAVWPNIKP
jgi:hypothetical protein